MNVKNILVSGIVAGIVILVVSFIVDAIITAIMPYNVLELGGMRAVDDPIMMLFFLSPIVTGLTVAALYDLTKSSFNGTAMQKGIRLGLIAWLVASVPSAWIVYTSMDYPIGFTVNSVVGSLLYLLAAGIVIARLGK